MFPTVLETANRAAEIVQQVCKTGLVDVDAIALSLTAGKPPPACAADVTLDCKACLSWVELAL